MDAILRATYILKWKLRTNYDIYFLSLKIIIRNLVQKKDFGKPVALENNN